MKLGDWRRREAMTQPDLAIALDVTLSSVARYETGTRMPEPDVMRRVYVVTDGSVQPNDFYDLPDLAVDRRAA